MLLYGCVIVLRSACFCPFGCSNGKWLTSHQPFNRLVGRLCASFQECPEVCRAFFVGCYDYADTVFQRNVRRLEECHEHLQEVLRAVPAGQVMRVRLWP